jgi:hypothetical protein
LIIIIIYSITFNSNESINFLKVITSFSHEIENVEDKSIENLKEVIELGVKQFSRDRFRVIKFNLFNYNKKINKIKIILEISRAKI